MLATLDGLAVFVHNPTGDIKQAIAAPIAFSPALFATIGGSAVFLGDSGADSIICVAADGTRRSIRLPFRRRHPDPSLIVAARDAELAMLRGDAGRALVLAKYSPQWLPRDLPYFEGLVSGHGDDVMVRESVATPGVPVRYIVIGANGISRALLSVPSGVQIMDVGADYLVGVHRDRDGVETVRMYGLERR